MSSVLAGDIASLLGVVRTKLGPSRVTGRSLLPLFESLVESLWHHYQAENLLRKYFSNRYFERKQLLIANKNLKQSKYINRKPHKIGNQPTRVCSVFSLYSLYSLYSLNSFSRQTVY